MASCSFPSSVKLLKEKKNEIFKCNEAAFKKIHHVAILTANHKHDGPDSYCWIMVPVEIVPEVTIVIGSRDHDNADKEEEPTEHCKAGDTSHPQHHASNLTKEGI